MLVFPNGKINIGLNITQRRKDGFHDIETVFYPIPWTDILEILPSQKEVFTFEGNTIDCEPKNNLCYKAYQLLKNDFDLQPIQLYLHKILPSGAGLGGGSSDAVFTLITLQKLFSLPLNEAALMQYASLLGSDCAFFIKNKAVYASGKGDVFSDISLDLSQYYVLVIKPPLHIATHEAYKMVEPHSAETHLPDTLKLPVEKWKLSVTNQFEIPVFSRYPQLKEIKNKLYSLGAIYAAMSGSGSAIYGLFEKKIDYQKEFPGTISWMNHL